MDIHQSLKVLGGLMALFLFIPMILGILKHGTEGQSGATWLLWGALDTILIISLIQQQGNYHLPLGFVIGDVLLVVLLVSKGQFKWGRLETSILVLVIGCVVAWKSGGSRMGTIAATMGISIAGIPGLVALWKKPQRTVGNVWAGYVVANGLSFFGGTAMTVEERFTPGVFALCSLAMFIASRRPRLKSTEDGGSIRHLSSPSP